MDYSACTQNTIAYIELHLSENLSLDLLADYSGFSKYHFLRIFERETGAGLWQYIQNRRMTKAAKLLMTTELPLIEIALLYRFDSQEAFTRAFKSVYGLPPGRYRRAMQKLFENKENTDMNQKQIIPGWLITGAAPDKYECCLDKDTFFKGTKSVYLKSLAAPLEDGDFGTVMQQFKAANYLGKRVRFSGFVKSKDVTGWGGLWMRIDGNTTNTLKFDNMQSRAIKGTTDWNIYSVVLDVPETSAIISIGILLSGEGELWLDNVRLEPVDKTVSTTDGDLSSELPDLPVNLSFEE